MESIRSDHHFALQSLAAKNNEHVAASNHLLKQSEAESEQHKSQLESQRTSHEAELQSLAQALKKSDQTSQQQTAALKD